MTRRKALLYSFFGPFLTLFPAGMGISILVGIAKTPSTSDGTRKLLYAAAIALGAVALVWGFAIRVQHAGWYVRDKKQPEGWKWISLLGVWGLIVLLVLTDRALPAASAPPLGTAPAIAPGTQSGSRGLSNTIAYLLIALALLMTGLMVWSSFQK
jgi:hypothetical protein